MAALFVPYIHNRFFSVFFFLSPSTDFGDDFKTKTRVLFGGSGFIPGILLLQCWIERAWADGYDPEGCEQLGGPGSLMGSEKWIGATECAVLLR